MSWIIQLIFLHTVQCTTVQDADRMHNRHHMSLTSTMNNHFVHWYFQRLYRGQTNTNQLYRPCSWNRSKKYFCALNMRKRMHKRTSWDCVKNQESLNDLHFPLFYYGRTISKTYIDLVSGTEAINKILVVLNTWKGYTNQLIGFILCM